MPQDDPKQPQGDDKKPPENNVNWRGLVLVFIAITLVAAAVWSKGSGSAGSDLAYPEFRGMLMDEDRGKLIYDDKNPLFIQDVAGSTEEFLIGTMLGDDGQNETFRTRVNLDLQKEEIRELFAAKTDGEGNVLREEIVVTPVYKGNTFSTVLVSLLPIFLILLILYFFFRQQMKMAGRGAMSFGKSKAKMMALDKSKVTFKNVAGVDEAKEEVWEIVEFLKDPKKFQRLGGHIPKGVLMVGSPGTGKTLLARAIAGEADVPFFSISGSDFVEMFVGVGASRVRDMFEQGRKNAPCLIFIDEIDAVGRHRGHGMGGGHDEREQTLNALLVEMDGFDTQEGVIIIAATNRPDVLDPALLRPGRFDRQVTVSLPDVKGRQEILRVHAKKVKMGDVDLGVIARGTPGYSGAELANVINEAALLASRKGLKAITLEELEEARDKVRWGKERRSMAISEKEKENTAYHEAGHAILLELLEHTEPLHKVTIIPRGPSLGSTMWLPEEDKYNMRKNEILSSLIVDMGGRVAEEIVFGDVTSGASGDIKMATDLARKMVCQWGMSEELGMVEYGDHNEHVFLAKDMGGGGRSYSEDTAQKIDREVKRLIDNAYNKAKSMLIERRTDLDLIAKALLEFETLDGNHIRDILAHGEMKDPPASPKPPEPPEETKSKELPKDDLPEKDGFGDLAPAGA